MEPSLPRALGHTAMTERLGPFLVNTKNTPSQQVSTNLYSNFSIAPWHLSRFFFYFSSHTSLSTHVLMKMAPDCWEMRVTRHTEHSIGLFNRIHDGPFPFSRSLSPALVPLPAIFQNDYIFQYLSISFFSLLILLMQKFTEGKSFYVFPELLNQSHHPHVPQFTVNGSADAITQVPFLLH